ncbi:MAG: cyclopropane-fatty-acyl-phospholipid synthase family protein [Immundisolibacter sp.]
MSGPPPAGLAPLPAGGPVQRLCRAMLRRRLAGLRHGVIELEEGGWRERFGRLTAQCGLSARVRVQHPRFYRALVLGGSIGAGRAYMDGDWSTDDLARLLRILAANLADWRDGDRWRARLARPLSALLRWWRDNSVAGSRRNVAAHYDLGNALFALFLDRDLHYSSAYFDPPQADLEQAQRAKADRVCRKLGLAPGDHLLEIGCGWGGLALHAARHYGCRVTATTVSRQQYALAVQRVRAAGLQDRVTVLCEDYRRLRGRYDKLAVVEVLEAVGHRRHGRFLAQCGRLLKPDGRMLLQAITIDERRHDAAAREEDFIQRYVFPGGSLPSLARLLRLLGRHTALRVEHCEDLAPHYVLTLRHWRRRFMAHAAQVQALGYPFRFVRLWEFYLAYCEAGFSGRALAAPQLLLAGPQARRSLLPGD